MAVRQEAAKHGRCAERERAQAVQGGPPTALAHGHAVHGHRVEHGVPGVQQREAQQVAATGEEHGGLEEACAVDAQGGNGRA